MISLNGQLSLNFVDWDTDMFGIGVLMHDRKEGREEKMGHLVKSLSL